jgi:hypothetical protein
MVTDWVMEQVKISAKTQGTYGMTMEMISILTAQATMLTLVVFVMVTEVSALDVQIQKHLMLTASMGIFLVVQLQLAVMMM